MEWSKRGNAWIWAVLGAIVLLAAILRVVNIQAGFWSDEIQTYRGASLPFDEVLSHRAYPLYYLVGHFILKLVDAEWALRLPSILAGVLGVLAMYGLGSAAGSRGAGLLAAFLLAASPFHLIHSQDARYYTFMMLEGALAIWLLHSVLEQPSMWKWILYILVCNLASVTHPFTLPAIAGIAVGGCAWAVFSEALTGWRMRLRRASAVLLFTALGTSLFWFTSWYSQFPRIIKAIRNYAHLLLDPKVLALVVVLLVVAAVVWRYWSRRAPAIEPAKARRSLNYVYWLLLAACLAWLAVWGVYRLHQARFQGEYRPSYRALYEISDEQAKTERGETALPIDCARYICVLRGRLRRRMECAC